MALESVKVREDQYAVMRRLAALHERSIAGEVRFALGEYIARVEREAEAANVERRGGEVRFDG